MGFYCICRVEKEITNLIEKIIVEFLKWRYSLSRESIVEMACMISSHNKKNKRNRDVSSGCVLRMIADSGCTGMMADLDKSELDGFTSASVYIQTASTQGLRSIGYGSFGPIAKLLSVPGLNTPLFSIFASCQEGRTAVFTKDKVQIFNEHQVFTTGPPILQGKAEGKTYYIDVSKDDEWEKAFVADTSVENQFTLWHQRLLHHSTRTLDFMRNTRKYKIKKGPNRGTIVEYNLVDGMDYPNLHRKRHSQCFCSACCLGKLHMKPQRKQALPKPTGDDLKPGELIFMDLFQSSVLSKHKYQYCLLIVDAKSKRLWQYCMKDKSDTLDCIVEWVQEVQAEGIMKLRTWTTIRSDNGGEFMSDDVKSYLRGQGIRKTTSAPYMHVNAIERQIQTVKDGIRTVINAASSELSRAATIYTKGKSKDPFIFWCDATATVVYTLNRMPYTKKARQTRHEMWSGERPNLSNLRTFGCQVYAKVYDELNNGTWSDRAYEGIFLGYDESCPHTYKVLNLQTQAVVNTSNLVFNENLRGQEVNLTMPLAQSKDETTVIPTVTLDTIFTSLTNCGVKVTKEVKQEFIQEFFKLQSRASWEAKTIGTNDVIEFSVANPIMHTVRRSEKRVLTRSQRRLLEDPNEIVKANLCRALSATEKREPNTLRQARSSKDWKKWEVQSLIDTKCLVPMLKPSGVKPLGLKWVFKIKEALDGSIERFKVRCTALGNLQKYGIDYEETFSPVVRMKTLRTIMAVSAVRDYTLHGMDIETAFLFGDVNPDDPVVYVKVPDYLPLPKHLERYRGTDMICCRVDKSMYGLKQSPRAFNQTLDKYMRTKLKFTRSQNDPCLYTRVVNGETIYVGVFVDDMVIAGSSEAAVKQFKLEIAGKFNVKDLGELKRILGMEVTRCADEGTLTLTQRKYIIDILTRFKMLECRPTSTPMEPGIVLSRRMSPKGVKEKQEAARFPYKELVGSLLYLSTHTRIDIAYAVAQLSRFMDSHGTEHHTAALYCLRYLKGTIERGITYGMDRRERLAGFSDSDWGKCIDTGKSVTGYVFYLGGGPISWTSKTQPTVAQSSTEAELMAATFTAKEAVHLRRLGSDFALAESKEPVVILEDNQGAIALSLNPIFHERTKHVRVRYFYVREAVEQGEVKLFYVRTHKQLADVLTKSTSKKIFDGMIDALMGRMGLREWFLDSDDHGEIEMFFEENDESECVESESEMEYSDDEYDIVSQEISSQDSESEMEED